MIKSILSVNGNKAMNFLLQTVLENKCHFIPANDVFQGMHHLKTIKTIKSLIVDLDFQTQQCWELIEHIKSSRLYRIPVIVLTTDNNDTLKRKCYEFEVDEVFLKPFNPLDLLAAVDTLMTASAISN